MRYFFLLLFIFLLGCDQTPADVVLVTVKWAKTSDELTAACGKDFFMEPGGCAQGGVLVTPNSNSCTITVLAKNGKAPSFDEHRVVESIGHEMLHCLTGKVHQ